MKINCDASASRAAAFGAIFELTEWFQDLHRYPKGTMLEGDALNADVFTKLIKNSLVWNDKCVQGMKARKELREQNVACAEAVYDVFLTLLRMVKRLQTVANAQALLSLSKGQQLEASCLEQLSKKTQSTAHVLQLPWEKELKELKEASGKGFSAIYAKADMAQAARACLDSGALKDCIFDKVHGMATAFCQQFSELLTAEVETSTTGTLKPIQAFDEKYSAIAAAVDSGSYAEIEWMYMEETEKEVFQDFQEFRANRKVALQLIEGLDAVMKFDSQSEQSAINFSQLAAIAKESKAQLDEKVHAATVLACMVLFGDQTCQEHGTQAGVSTVEKFTQKTYGMGWQDMPEKMQERIKALPEKGPDDEKEAAPAKAESKESKKDKEKEKVKGKGEKHKKSDKEKTSEKASSVEVMPPPAKKSKKEKKSK